MAILRRVMKAKFSTIADQQRKLFSKIYKRAKSYGQNKFITKIMAISLVFWPIFELDWRTPKSARIWMTFLCVHPNIVEWVKPVTVNPREPFLISDPPYAPTIWVYKSKKHPPFPSEESIPGWSAIIQLHWSTIVRVPVVGWGQMWAA